MNEQRRRKKKSKNKYKSTPPSKMTNKRTGRQKKDNPKGIGSGVKRGKGIGSSIWVSSPQAKAEYARKRRAEDKYWASLAGPVTVRKVGDAA